jgi:MbnP
MRNLLFLFFVNIALLVGSCKENPQVQLSSDVKLNFKANFNGELLLLEKEYLYADTMPIKFSQFNFYIASVSLIKQNGNEFEETELLEIDFVDFPYNLNQETEAEKGQTIQINKIPVGDYDGIKIGFGVPADLNRTKTNEYGSENPLSMTSHYWNEQNSYIFSKIEGTADMDYDGTFETNTGEGLTYHMGTDDVYTTRTLFENISLKANETLELQLNIDLQKLFLMSDPAYDENGDGYLDIEKFESVQTEDRLEIAKQIMNNYSEAISLVQ